MRLVDNRRRAHYHRAASALVNMWYRKGLRASRRVVSQHLPHDMSHDGLYDARRRAQENTHKIFTALLRAFYEAGWVNGDGDAVVEMSDLCFPTHGERVDESRAMAHVPEKDLVRNIEIFVPTRSHADMFDTVACECVEAASKHACVALASVDCGQVEVQVRFFVYSPPATCASL